VPPPEIAHLHLDPRDEVEVAFGALRAGVGALKVELEQGQAGLGREVEREEAWA
jgi:hypothetical protein